jgi:phosphopentomutase
MRRVVLVVIDACGIGELPDAATYNDQGANTIPNVAKAVGGLQMPTCQTLGLGNIAPITGVPSEQSPIGSYGKMAERSPGKDSTTGHWEIAGVVLNHPFPVFPNGFPQSIVDEFERKTGVKTIGNVAASGTEIIERLGEEHMRTGKIILYTSADSVFQLAAHDEIIPLKRLYEICQIARDMLVGEYQVGRVIARPFIGTPGNFTRTAGRKDFSVQPPSLTLLDALTKKGASPLSIGKIYDLFDGKGISKAIKTANNTEGIAALIAQTETDTQSSLIFTNLVDFDQNWGHRNDEVNFAKALEEFDRGVNDLLPKLREEDILIITADHGCDPTMKHSTDHTREYVPLLVYGKRLKPGVNLGTRTTFSDVAATVAEYLGVSHKFPGTSFLSQISL